ncbi:MAG: exonuclease domain-containing protein [Candidatus Izemoplasmataceae bacterium]
MTTTINGIILGVNELDRIVKIKTRKRIYYVYFQRAMFNQFSQFFDLDNRIKLSIKTQNPQTKKHRYLAINVEIIQRHSLRKIIALFSMHTLAEDTQKFINDLDYKLFLDLEMSMHPYRKDANFIQEIIQVGYVIANKDDEIIKHYQTIIKPTIHPTLTKRTLKFLDITQEIVNQGVDFKTFYDEFYADILKYNPAIVVWGKNDHLALKEAYQLYKMPSLTKKTRFVNLLNLHKTIYHLKNDLGLLKAYQLYGYEIDNQRHDAYEDALMTYKIFLGFKAVLNGLKSVAIEQVKN